MQYVSVAPASQIIVSECFFFLQCSMLILKHILLSKVALQILILWLYLETKLVEEVVDEIFAAIEDAIVQMLACYIVENSSCDRRGQVVLHTVEILVTVNCHFKRQEGQHQQIIL